jgi:hypothetical protein
VAVTTSDGDLFIYESLKVRPVADSVRSLDIGIVDIVRQRCRVIVEVVVDVTRIILSDLWLLDETVHLTDETPRSVIRRVIDRARRRARERVSFFEERRVGARAVLSDAVLGADHEARA